MGQKPRGPRHREAYPKLDILQASTSFRSGRNLCVYRHERGGVLGVLQFTPSSDWQTAILFGQLQGPQVPYWSGEFLLRLLQTKNCVTATRRAAACPGCGRRVQMLYCVGGWSCAKCHRLHYRRQLVDRLTLAAEDLQEFEEQLTAPRPKWMHQRTFAKKRAADQASVDRLKPLLKDPWRRVASAAHQARVEGTWMSLRELHQDPQLRPFSIDL